MTAKKQESKGKLITKDKELTPAWYVAKRVLNVHNVTYNDMAEKLGVSVTTVHDLCNYAHSSISSTLRRRAKRPLCPMLTSMVPPSPAQRLSSPVPTVAKRSSPPSPSSRSHKFIASLFH